MQSCLLLYCAEIQSQALLRWLLPPGFYEQVLEDDGHVLSRVMPPRDFREWERYPVSAIANYQPAILHELDRTSLQVALETFPYSRLLYQQYKQPPGLVLQKEARESVINGQAVPVHAAPTCLRTDAIVKVQRQLVDSIHGIAVVLDQDAGQVIGLVTLHDLLRAQQNFAAQACRVVSNVIPGPVRGGHPPRF